MPVLLDHFSPFDASCALCVPLLHPDNRFSSLPSLRPVESSLDGSLLSHADLSSFRFHLPTKLLHRLRMIASTTMFLTRVPVCSLRRRRQCLSCPFATQLSFVDVEQPSFLAYVNGKSLENMNTLAAEQLLFSPVRSLTSCVRRVPILSAFSQEDGPATGLSWKDLSSQEVRTTENMMPRKGLTFAF